MNTEARGFYLKKNVFHSTCVGSMPVMSSILIGLFSLPLSSRMIEINYAQNV
jgi:hypothetical protein